MSVSKSDPSWQPGQTEHILAFRNFTYKKLEGLCLDWKDLWQMNLKI